MNTNPDMLGRLVKERHHQLQREAEGDRLAAQARSEQPTHLMRMRRRLMALVVGMRRTAQPRAAGDAQKAGVKRSLA